MPLLPWLLLIGALLLLTSFLSGWIHRGPVTTFAIFLAVGVIVGPGVLGLASLGFTTEHVHWLRLASEAALVVSLFITGLKLRIGLHDRAWRMAFRLALPGMVLTAAGVALVARWLLGWDWPWSLALAAMVSPTDPVLAALVSVDDARDDDPLRLSLSAEAGLNDATALPLLLLALPLMASGVGFGDVGVHWALVDVAWGFGGGLLIGLIGGAGLGYLGARLRHASKDVAPSDFFALGIMLVVYALCEMVGASAFLAAFASGVGLRWVERRVSRHAQEDTLRAGGEASQEPAETLVRPNERARATVDHPAQTVGWVISDALSFGETVERLIASMLVMLVGIVALPALGWPALGVAVMLMLILRPLAVWISTIGSRVPWQRRLLIGWFGIRGLGTLNYLAYGVSHGMSGPRVAELEGIVVTVVAASILAHGMSVTPLMRWRERALQRLHEARGAP
ncbi:cation:proton antiporter [Bacillus sp. NP157]|nr:cation:proton antiporter [Bacillus sp. NP157]